LCSNTPPPVSAVYSIHPHVITIDEEPVTMVSDSLSNASPAGLEVDSLSANEFAVELDGERIGPSTAGFARRSRPGTTA
jgi:hypothetical protein